MMTRLSPRRYSVLITDDDEAHCRKVSAGLEPEGYDTLVARCGLEAVKIIKRERIHVVILDMYMPDMTGLETLELITQSVKEPPPSILVSRCVTKDLMMNAILAHAHTLMHKPLDLGLTRRILRALIRQRYLA